jgi:two-component system response regulator AlgR
MKLLIVDDEPLARTRLRTLLTEIEGCEVVGEAANGQQALDLVEEVTPELILLDIEMPGTDGIETASKLQKLSRPPAIIFTTAYDQHALDAFQAGGQAYLLKPVNRQELKDTIQRVSKITQLQSPQADAQTAQQRTHLTVTIRGDIRRIPIENIFYFHAEQKYVVIKHVDGEALTEESLKSLSKDFAHNFIRVHRSSLVSKVAISELRRNNKGFHSVYLKPLDMELEVSRRHVAKVRKMIKN